MPPPDGRAEIRHPLPARGGPAPQGGASLHRLPYPGGKNSGRAPAAPDRQGLVAHVNRPQRPGRGRHEDLRVLPSRGPVQADPGGHAERGQEPRQHPPLALPQGHVPFLPAAVLDLPCAGAKDPERLPRGSQHGTARLVLDGQGRPDHPRGGYETVYPGALEALDGPPRTRQGRRRAIRRGGTQGEPVVRGNAFRGGREAHRPRVREKSGCKPEKTHDG